MGVSAEQMSGASVALDSDLDRFVYHISHDLRASMRAMTMVPQWIEEDLRDDTGDVPASVSEHVRVLTDQALRLDLMMQDLLVFSRVGRMQSVEVVQIETALDEVLAELDPPPTFELTRDIQVVDLTCGTADIRTLLRVLVVNALKHGGPHAHISTKIEDGKVVMIVHDDGPGIDPKHHTRIFEMMTTLRPRDEIEGSGLGLAIARKIMGRYGGTIDVESDPTVGGATFTMVFPQDGVPAE